MQLLQTGCPRLSIETDESAINAASEEKIETGNTPATADEIANYEII